MSGVTQILGALGGGVVFVGALVAVVRGIFRQVNATESNTAALNGLRTELQGLDSMLTNHESRISRLEGRFP